MSRPSTRPRSASASDHTHNPKRRMTMTKTIQHRRHGAITTPATLAGMALGLGLLGASGPARAQYAYKQIIPTENLFPAPTRNNLNTPKPHYTNPIIPFNYPNPSIISPQNTNNLNFTIVYTSNH